MSPRVMFTWARRGRHGRIWDVVRVSELDGPDGPVTADVVWSCLAPDEAIQLAELLQQTFEAGRRAQEGR